MKQSVNIVWFKKDLRINDHAALSQAAINYPVLPIFTWDQLVWQSDDYATQHIQFVRECLNDLTLQLKKIGLTLYQSDKGIIELLSQLNQHYHINGLYSHQDTGNLNSYELDKQVMAWCKKHQICWYEYPQNGVVRGLKNRNDWTSIWQQRMHTAMIPVPQCNMVNLHITPPSVSQLQSIPHLKKPQPDKPLRQKGGSAHAYKALDTFLNGRACHYHTGISSPIIAAESGSRISPYLTWGVLSVKQVMQALWQQYLNIQNNPNKYPRNLINGLKAFESRMHWHCHFIQKLESQPDIEIQNLHQGFNGIRDERYQSDEAKLRLAIWRQGHTGWPLVDACLAMLRDTGWINFRMRAMLMSTASHLYWLHWRETGLFLANEFLDYEPGIHWPQVQMQSATTGINTIRIYNPIKQARDHDPQGLFVRRWIPALKNVANSWIFEPWLMTPELQKEFHCIIGESYPKPLINHDIAIKSAKEKLFNIKRQTRHLEDTKRIIDLHASRKPSLKRKSASNSSKVIKQQGSLF